MAGTRGEVDSLHWWTEGIAEYVAALVSPHLDPPPFETPYTLAQLLLHSDSLRTRYGYRHLAVRFFMEHHRAFVDIIVGHMRRGELDAYRAFLEREVGRYSDAWDTWLRTGGATVVPISVDLPYLLVPLFPAHVEDGRHGFVRVVNLSGRVGDVDIVAVDDAGNRFEPTTLLLRARQAVQFNSRDLEIGNPDKGLSRGVGPGEGDWRLELSSALDILVIGYVRTPDGFVAPMADVAERYRGGYLVPTFNPARNGNQVSSLRIGNLGDTDAEVTISGVDDEGMESWEVKTRVGAFATRTLSAENLEAGAVGLEGSLGRGAGKWRLFVSSPEPILRHELAGDAQRPSGESLRTARRP